MFERRVAFLFPGQGSQYPGMGQDLHDRHVAARAVFEEADAVLGFALSRLCFEGPESDLQLTHNTQPAVLTVSIAALRALEPSGLRAVLVAGHSLGEYAALVAAGSLSFADAVRLVRARGQYMQEAVAVGKGAMAAILGLETKMVAEVCEEAARGEVVVAANYNSPDQTVIAGHADGVRRTVALAEARGAQRAIMLPVSAPFHSPLMEPAQQRLARAFDGIAFADPRIPVLANVDARPIATGVAARDALVRQVTSPVLWTDTVRRIHAEGITTVVELGPGRVLTSLVRRIERGLERFNVEDSVSLASVVQALTGGAA